MEFIDWFSTHAACCTGHELRHNRAALPELCLGDDPKETSTEDCLINNFKISHFSSSGEWGAKSLSNFKNTAQISQPCAQYIDHKNETLKSVQLFPLMSLSLIKIWVMSLHIVCSVRYHLNNQRWAGRVNRHHCKSEDWLVGPGGVLLPQCYYSEHKVLHKFL